MILCGAIITVILSKKNCGVADRDRTNFAPVYDRQLYPYKKIEIHILKIREVLETENGFFQ